MAEVLGIENLKKLVKFSCDLTKQIVESTEDGIQWTDLFSFVDEAAQIPGIGKSFPQVKAELADLTAEERQELHAYLVDEFDIPNDKLETAIENSLQTALALIALYEMWKSIKAA
jgi:hypothetical protein